MPVFFGIVDGLEQRPMSTPILYGMVVRFRETRGKQPFSRGGIVAARG